MYSLSPSFNILLTGNRTIMMMIGILRCLSWRIVNFYLATVPIISLAQHRQKYGPSIIIGRLGLVQ
jgi:hypothetical protein